MNPSLQQSLQVPHDSGISLPPATENDESVMASFRRPAGLSAATTSQAAIHHTSGYAASHRVMEQFHPTTHVSSKVHTLRPVGVQGTAPGSASTSPSGLPLATADGRAGAASRATLIRRLHKLRHEELVLARMCSEVLSLLKSKHVVAYLTQSMAFWALIQSPALWRWQFGSAASGDGASSDGRGASDRTAVDVLIRQLIKPESVLVHVS